MLPPYSNQYNQIYRDQYLNNYHKIEPDVNLTHQKIKEDKKTNVYLAQNENDEIKIK
jgi:hypothetical protein